MGDPFIDIDEVIGLKKLPEWGLDLSLDGSDTPFLMAKCAIVQTGHMNRIATALEELVRLKQLERTEARRRGRK
jgi:hypothetical protein